MIEVLRNITFAISIISILLILYHLFRFYRYDETLRFRMPFLLYAVSLVLYFLSNLAIIQNWFLYDFAVVLNQFFGFLTLSFFGMLLYSQSDLALEKSARSRIIYLPFTGFIFILPILVLSYSNLNPFGVIYPIRGIGNIFLNIAFFLYIVGYFIVAFIIEAFTTNRIFKVRVKVLLLFFLYSLLFYIFMLVFVEKNYAVFSFALEEFIGISITYILMFLSMYYILRRFFFPSVYHIVIRIIYYFIAIFITFLIVVLVAEYYESMFILEENLPAYILNSGILLGLFYFNAIIWNFLRWVFDIVEREVFVLPHIRILDDFSKDIYKHFDTSKLSYEFGNLFLYTYFSKKVEIWLYESQTEKFKLKADIGFLPPVKENQKEISENIIEKIKNFKYQLVFRCLLRIYPRSFLREHSYIIELMELFGAHLLLVIRNHKKVYGFLVAKDVSGYMEFLRDDYEILSHIAEEIADIIDNMEKYISVRESKLIQRDWVIAEEIQKSLLPVKIPEFEDFKIAIYFSTVKGIGGDYYDVFKIDEDEMGVLLNDVAGKGLPAALVMAVIRSIVHASLEFAHQPKKLLTHINSTIYGQVSLDRYSTEYYFVYNKEKNEILYSNAGIYL